jgi:hypothetical protein
MHQFFALLADFDFQEMCAIGLFGAGVVLVASVFTQIGTNRKLQSQAKKAPIHADEDEPGWRSRTEKKTEPDKPMSPLTGMLLFFLGVAFVIGGIVWRAYRIRDNAN